MIKLGMLSQKNISSTKDEREANKNRLYVHDKRLSLALQNMPFCYVQATIILTSLRHMSMVTRCDI